MIVLETHIPLITDWITASGVILGLPTAVWGIFTLFIKDKSRERQLSTLEKVA